MRTTVDLPDDLHQRAKAFARDRGLSLTETIVLILRRGFGDDDRVEVSTDAGTGLPTVRLGATITSDDVRSLEDDL